MIISRHFYDRNTATVARELLGATLFVKTAGGVLNAVITETEAYCGESDLACHASKGRTKRTEVMFGEPGIAYVYMIYGIYYCLNIVTRKAGFAEAVLIRCVETADGTQLNGPGKTCRYFGIDKSYNACDVTTGDRIWVEKTSAKRESFRAEKRVGVDYAGEWKDEPLRFILVKKYADSLQSESRTKEKAKHEKCAAKRKSTAIEKKAKR
ncbi:MAG TPA: DNA-3-methyladenine glycosylase [Candidatus Wallbacteria bacterium]|nr:DNA-3-methyladenine glycosylase [Candidatus Wallbacteria bacterium]